MQLYIPLNLLGTVYREITQARFRRHGGYVPLAQPAARGEGQAGRQAARRHGRRDQILDNVVFSYEPERTVLKGVSFHRARRQDSCGGRPLSGAGKSTISRILYRSLATSNPEADYRRAGPPADVTQASLRAVIGIVPQDTAVLFNDSGALQHRLWPPRRDRGRDQGSGALGRPDRQIHRLSLLLGYDGDGGRARIEACPAARSSASPSRARSWQ